MTQIVVLFFFLWSEISPADSLHLGLRYRSHRSRDNTVDPVVLYQRPLVGPIDWELGARFQVAFSAWEAFDYKTELRWDLVPYLGVLARLFQSNQVALGAAWTQGLLLARGRLPVAPFLRVEVDAGWQRRWVALTASLPLPWASRTSYSDEALCARIAFIASLAPTWQVTANLSTFEEFDAYNLNSPFLQLGTRYQPEGVAWDTFFFARYRPLLGFGRKDEWAFGIGWEWPLS